MQRTYSWYKHHAWAALAMLSIFFALTRFYEGLSDRVEIIVVAALSIYALVAILFTYKHNMEHAGEMKEPLKSERNDKIFQDSMDSTKEHEKLIKKRLKTEQKSLKKTRKE